MAALSDSAQQAKNGVTSISDPDEKKKVVQQLNAEMFPTGDDNRTLIWVVLLVGLFLIAIISIFVAANLSKGKDGTAYVAVTSAVVAGVFGLFAKSPTD